MTDVKHDSLCCSSLRKLFQYQVPGIRVHNMIFVVCTRWQTLGGPATAPGCQPATCTATLRSILLLETPLHPGGSRCLIHSVLEKKIKNLLRLHSLENCTRSKLLCLKEYPEPRVVFLICAKFLVAVKIDGRNVQQGMWLANSHKNKADSLWLYPLGWFSFQIVCPLSSFVIHRGLSSVIPLLFIKMVFRITLNVSARHGLLVSSASLGLKDWDHP